MHTHTVKAKGTVKVKDVLKAKGTLKEATGGVKAKGTLKAVKGSVKAKGSAKVNDVLKAKGGVKGNGSAKVKDVLKAKGSVKMKDVLKAQDSVKTKDSVKRKPSKTSAVAATTAQRMAAPQQYLKYPSTLTEARLFEVFKKMPLPRLRAVMAVGNTAETSAATISWIQKVELAEDLERLGRIPAWEVRERDVIQKQMYPLYVW